MNILRPINILTGSLLRMKVFWYILLWAGNGDFKDKFSCGLISIMCPSVRLLSLKCPCWDASLPLPCHYSGRNPCCRLTHFILCDAVYSQHFFYCILVITIKNFHNSCSDTQPSLLALHHLLHFISSSHFNLRILHNLTPYFSCYVTSSHSIFPTFPALLTKPEGTIGPLSLVSTMLESHSCPPLTFPSHCFSK